MIMGMPCLMISMSLSIMLKQPRRLHRLETANSSKTIEKLSIAGPEPMTCPPTDTDTLAPYLQSVYSRCTFGLPRPPGTPHEVND